MTLVPFGAAMQHCSFLFCVRAFCVHVQLIYCHFFVLCYSKYCNGCENILQHFEGAGR